MHRISTVVSMLALAAAHSSPGEQERFNIRLIDRWRLWCWVVRSDASRAIQVICQSLVTVVLVGILALLWHGLFAGRYRAQTLVFERRIELGGCVYVGLWGEQRTLETIDPSTKEESCRGDPRF